MTEFAAIDLGASSGRVVLRAASTARVMTLEELPSLREPACAAAGRAALEPAAPVRRGVTGALRGRTLDGVGVDTWGVDYALLDDARPRARAARSTTATPAPTGWSSGRTDACRAECYAVTGIQTCRSTRVFQLLADEGSAALREAHAIALVPDLLA